MDFSIYGWDIAYAIRLPELNARLQDVVEPVRIETRAGSLQMVATVSKWRFVPGGSGKLLKAVLSLSDGELRSHQGQGETFAATATLTIELDAIAHDVATDQSGVLLTVVPPQSEDVVFVNSVRVESGRRELANNILVGLRQWFDEYPETIEHVIAAVYLADRSGTDLETWLRPTSISYAYADGPHAEDCVLAILGMTGERTFAGLDQQISRSLIPPGANSAILVSPRLFLDTIVRKSLPLSFPGTSVEDYEISETAHRVRLKAPRLLETRVAAADSHFQPLMTHMEISIAENILVSRVHCQISQEGVFTAYAEHSCFHQLVLDRSAAGGPAMMFAMSGQPVSKNWLEVTPEHKHRGEMLSYGVYALGAVASLVTGGVGGIVIGVVSTALGQLAEKAGDIAESMNTIQAPTLDLLGLHLAAPCLWAGDRILNARDIELNQGLRLSGDLERA